MYGNLAGDLEPALCWLASANGMETEPIQRLEVLVALAEHRGQDSLRHSPVELRCSHAFHLPCSTIVKMHRHDEVVGMKTALQFLEYIWRALHRS